LKLIFVQIKILATNVATNSKLAEEKTIIKFIFYGINPAYAAARLSTHYHRITVFIYYFSYDDINYLTLF
jgi:hypothetical protein